VHRLRCSPLLAGLHSLLGATRWDRPALEFFRNGQMRVLLRHAYDNVAYYRELFDQNGLRPSDIRTVEDLQAIPVTYKKDLQPLPLERVTANGVDFGKLITRRSSGSTGEPFAIRRTWSEERLLQAFRRRALYLFGQRPRDRTVGVVRVRGIDPNDHQLVLRAVNAVGFYRAEYIDCFLPFSEIIKRLQRNRFEILGGLSGVLYHLAMQINQKSLRIAPPRFVTTGGEALTEQMRREIETAFGARVFDIYGCHEFNILAWQCKRTGEYHICDDSVILEIVKDGRPARVGEQGDVVATGLFSYSMPFIRYHVGDIVVRGFDRCPCGAAFSTIRDIRGRTIDYVALRDGRHIHPYQIIRFLVHAEKPWIRKYQLIQESMSRIVLKVAPFGTAESEMMQKLDNEVSALLGRDIGFRIELVDDIPTEKSGKFKVFKSLVTPTAGPNVV
jgi:phenylacetate-CoA ligase